MCSLFPLPGKHPGCLPTAPATPAAAERGPVARMPRSGHGPREAHAARRRLGSGEAGDSGGRGQLRCPPPTKSTPPTHGDTKLPVFFQPALEPFPY